MNENILNEYQDILNSITILYVYKSELYNDCDSELISILNKNVPNFMVVDTKEALNQAQARDIDIVITDMDVECEECTKIFSTIRHRNPTCSIIIYSSDGDPEHLIKAIDLKVDKFFIKPTDSDNILKSIVALGEYAFTLKSLRDIKIDSTHLDIEAFDLISSSIDDLRAIVEKTSNRNCGDALSLTYAINEIIKKLKKVIKDSY